jgi:hypothetical protein
LTIALLLVLIKIIICNVPLSNGKSFRKTFNFPELIDRGYPGADWKDVNHAGKPDYCRNVGVAPSVIRKCLISNGTSFIGEQ